MYTPQLDTSIIVAESSETTLFEHQKNDVSVKENL